MAQRKLLKFPRVLMRRHVPRWRTTQRVGINMLASFASRQLSDTTPIQRQSVIGPGIRPTVHEKTHVFNQLGVNFSLVDLHLLQLQSSWPVHMPMVCSQSISSKASIWVSAGANGVSWTSWDHQVWGTSILHITSSH